MSDDKQSEAPAAEAIPYQPRSVAFRVDVAQTAGGIRGGISFVLDPKDLEEIPPRDKRASFRVVESITPLEDYHGRPVGCAVAVGGVEIFCHPWLTFSRPREVDGNHE